MCMILSLILTLPLACGVPSMHMTIKCLTSLLPPDVMLDVVATICTGLVADLSTSPDGRR